MLTELGAALSPLLQRVTTAIFDPTTCGASSGNLTDSVTYDAVTIQYDGEDVTYRSAK